MQSEVKDFFVNQPLTNIYFFTPFHQRVADGNRCVDLGNRRVHVLLRFSTFPGSAGRIPYAGSSVA